MFTTSTIANFIAIAAFLAYGLQFFAHYHRRGARARNITDLFAGLGMLAFVAALLVTPANAQVLLRLSTTKAATVLLVVSSGFLIAAIVSFGVLTYWAGQDSAKKPDD